MFLVAESAVHAQIRLMPYRPYLDHYVFKWGHIIYSLSKFTVEIMNIIFRYIKVFFLLIFSSVSWSGNIVLTPSFSTISDESTSFRLTVSNNESHIAYIKLVAVENVCTDPKEKYVCTNREEESTKLSQQLYFTSERFILNPGQKKVIFAAWKGDLPEEPFMMRIYADDQALEAVKTIKQSGIGNRSDISFEVKVRTIVQSRVFVQKNNTSQKKPEITRIDNQLYIKNPGTAPLYTRIYKQCNLEKDCKRFNKENKNRFNHFIEPMSEEKILIPFNSPIEVSFFDVLQNKWKTDWSQ